MCAYAAGAWDPEKVRAPRVEIGAMAGTLDGLDARQRRVAAGKRSAALRKAPNAEKIAAAVAALEAEGATVTYGAVAARSGVPRPTVARHLDTVAKGATKQSKGCLIRSIDKKLDAGRASATPSPIPSDTTLVQDTPVEDKAPAVVEASAASHAALTLWERLWTDPASQDSRTLVGASRGDPRRLSSSTSSHSPHPQEAASHLLPADEDDAAALAPWGDADMDDAVEAMLARLASRRGDQDGGVRRGHPVSEPDGEDGVERDGEPTCGSAPGSCADRRGVPDLKGLHEQARVTPKRVPAQSRVTQMGTG